MNKPVRSAALLLAFLLLFAAGCAAKEQPEQSVPAQTETAAPAQESGKTSQVADASQMTTVEAVVEDGMVPVYADELIDGVYSVAVSSSSSMFRIADCALRVADGAMSATLTMSSTSYGYLYPGTAAEAAAAAETDYLAPDESGTAFVLPVEALDAGVPCAAWSRNKELWYDRTLVFRADSLPLSAFKSLTTAETLALADGAYTVEVTLGGGSGRASVQSPARLTVDGGAATAEIVWSSANYDYMRLDDEVYLPVNTEGNSAFLIPVAVFDRPFAVIADTTAMSQPHEIEYTLRFDAATVRAAP